MTSPPNSPPPEQQQDPAAPPVITTRTLTAELVTLSEINSTNVPASLTVWLDYDGAPPQATDTGELYLGQHNAPFDDTGTLTLELVPNSRITPHTRYRASLAVTGDEARVFVFTMPDRDADLVDLIPRVIPPARGLALSGGGVLLLSDGSRLLV